MSNGADMCFVVSWFSAIGFRPVPPGTPRTRRFGGCVVSAGCPRCDRAAIRPLAERDTRAAKRNVAHGRPLPCAFGRQFDTTCHGTTRPTDSVGGIPGCVPESSLRTRRLGRNCRGRPTVRSATVLRSRFDSTVERRPRHSVVRSVRRSPRVGRGLTCGRAADRRRTAGPGRGPARAMKGSSLRGGPGPPAGPAVPVGRLRVCALWLR